MDLMERRLRDGLSDRNGTERYEMRMIPGQDVKTGNMREWRRGEWRRVWNSKMIEVTLVDNADL
jgi:hypothetical protein